MMCFFKYSSTATNHIISTEQLIILFCFLITTQIWGSSLILNNPYPRQDNHSKVFYNSFLAQPKTLDPAKSYDMTEHLFMSQTYEPLLDYDYLARPYKLIPLTAAQMPQLRYFDSSWNEVTETSNQVAYTTYTIHIKPGIRYQPHPAFAKNKRGDYIYYPIQKNYLKKHDIRSIMDFESTGTRELVSDDYIYQIKRLATPSIASSIYGLMSQYILGFDEFALKLPNKGSLQGYLDLRQYPMDGLKKIDDYTFEITIKGQYTQFIFWLAMRFFSPVPWEVERFYSQPGMVNRNLGLNWYPVGTGPFMMTENNPNSRVILLKNPNYRTEYAPADGSTIDKEAGYLRHAGERIPMIDKAVFTLEKESIPRWSKFLQGYYDSSGITADSFDEAIKITPSGTIGLTDQLTKKNMRLTKVIETTTFYLGINMLDSQVGGYSARAKKLRQAISIAVNYDEYISIFLNGRGKAAQGPIPPGIFGYKIGAAGMNPYVYRWDGYGIVRRPIADAKALMVEAGYPDGIDPSTNRPLILNYDVQSTGGPDDKAQMDWMRKQFAKIGIDLNIRATLYNRFQEKIRMGDTQLFSWGWSADYPDPENFLFLLYSGNGKVLHGGENASNYNNPKFDDLFKQIKNRPNDSTRAHLIDEMIAILREDTPWVWGIQNETFMLNQSWTDPIKTNTISLNTLKYTTVNVDLRNRLRGQWNKPIIWPVGLCIMLVVAFCAPFIYAYRKNQRRLAARLS